MSTQDIVQKLWNLCNVLRDDGITYHQYVTELTYILFLKMLDETGEENTLKADMLKAYQNSLEQYARRKGKAVEQLTEEEKESRKPLLYNYSWEYLTTLEGIELKNYYMKLLSELGSTGIPKISDIYAKAVSSIEEPKNLQKIISEINKLDWFEAKQEGLGDLYEGLLQKNADEKKSGAGQYFTPRVLIDVMTDLISPKLGEKCFDPACGTFGFMISAYQHAIDGVDLYSLSDQEMAAFQDSFYGVELVHDAHRLALMNAYLHNVPAHISCEDSLAPSAKRLKGFDVILTNPPFGTKKGGERTSRDDISFQTFNKQLNFLQVIYRSLKADGSARCAVVLPDNVLFADGDGTSVRRELMDFCNLHTILRLPTGIFYAQGVKTNVLFFTRGKTEKDNTKEVWFYDLRTNMPSFGKTAPLKEEHFIDFVKAYTAEDRHAVDDERWSVFTREQIGEKGDTLDLGLIRDDSAIEGSYRKVRSFAQKNSLFPQRVVAFYSGTNNKLFPNIKVVNTRYTCLCRDTLRNFLKSMNDDSERFIPNFPKRKYNYCEEGFTPVYLLSILCGQKSFEKSYLIKACHFDKVKYVDMVVNTNKVEQIFGRGRFEGDVPTGLYYLTDFIDYRFTDLLRRGFMYSSNGKSYFQITNIDSVNIDSIAILEFFEKLYSLFETRFEVTVTQGESNVKCSEMSEGQRQLIKILGMLGICKTEDCLVLMDEPDAYMNPRWKYEIKETMDNSLRDAINTQAIVATHDPLVINGVPKEFIRIFTHNENLVSNNGYYFTKVIVPTEDTEGMGIDGLLQSEYYGLSSVLDSETKDKMDEKHRLLIKKKDGTITDNEKYKLLELTNDLENMSFTRNIPTDSYYDEYVAAMHKIYSERPHVNLSAEDIAERNAKAEEILKGLLEK